VSGKIKPQYIDSILEILHVLKNSKTINDYNNLLNWVLSVRPESLTKSERISSYEFLLNSGFESSTYIKALFAEQQVDDATKIGYVKKLAQTAVSNDGIWFEVSMWIESNLLRREQVTLLRELIGNNIESPFLLTIFYKVANIFEVRSRVERDFNLYNVQNRAFQPVALQIIKRFRNHPTVLEIMRKYLELDNSIQNIEFFGHCLRVLKGDSIAIEKALDYLENERPDLDSNSFTAALYAAKEEEEAKRIAQTYLEQYQDIDMKKEFSMGLRLMACATILCAESESFLHKILNGSLDRYPYQTFNRALSLANECGILEKEVERICIEKIAQRREKEKLKNLDFKIYSHLLKIPLFRIKIWRQEVELLLRKPKYINRSVFYSITISHINRPEILANACLFFIRNWKGEFSRERKYWGYFIRCLAHPSIVENLKQRQEVRHICREILASGAYPFEVGDWLELVAVEDDFPVWIDSNENTTANKVYKS